MPRRGTWKQVSTELQQKSHYAKMGGYSELWCQKTTGGVVSSRAITLQTLSLLLFFLLLVWYRDLKALL